MFTKPRHHPPGDVEIENWITWKTSKPDDRDFDQIDFRHEIESGITNRLQAAVYVADWSYAHGASVDDPGFMYSASALQLVYNLTIRWRTRSGFLCIRK